MVVKKCAFEGCNKDAAIGLATKTLQEMGLSGVVGLCYEHADLVLKPKKHADVSMGCKVEGEDKP